MDTLFLALAAAEAEKFIGSTAPNPPVGACLVKDGQVVSLGAHKRAGYDHAEVAALKMAMARGVDPRGATLYVTLEPCNHYGRTPPCTKAILETGISRVVYGAKDPNPQVAGNGAATLREAGLVVDLIESTLCSRLIDGFTKRVRTGTPWVVLKAAFRESDAGAFTMIPEPGSKTFTSDDSLLLAHMERKKCDAILTGFGTVIADDPMFTVRHVPDHPGKRRILGVLTTTGRELPREWVARQSDLGFDVLSYRSIDEALSDCGERGCLRVLVEAGPTVVRAFDAQKRWDEKLIVISNGKHDLVARELACSQE